MAEAWEQRRSGEEISRPLDTRPPFEKDRARVIHSAGFRRLQAKTQVLGISEGDFHRTRLTHSMEVAQVSRGIVYTLREQLKNVNHPLHGALDKLPRVGLIETIAFCHDLGHPPFGHGGESALNYMMRDDGGFEGNGQSLRLVACLEAHKEGFGLDLTRRALLGILKYPAALDNLKRKKAPAIPGRLEEVRISDWRPPKGYMSSEGEIVSWILSRLSVQDRDRFTEIVTPTEDFTNAKPRYKSLDASIVEIADDISYGVHDLEDGIVLRLIGYEQWIEEQAYDAEWASQFGLGSYADITKDLFGDSEDARKKVVGDIVHALITSVELRNDTSFEEPILALNAGLSSPAEKLLRSLKELVVRHIIKLQTVQTIEYNGQYVVMSLFEAMSSDPQRLMSPHFVDHYDGAPTPMRKRVICDYISGMTDSYASRMFERLFRPGFGKVFERL